MNAPLLGGIVAVVVGAIVALIGFRQRSKRGPLLKAVGAVVAVAGIVVCLLFAPTDPPPERWQRHATADGACSAEFPESPQRDTRTEDGGTTSTLEVAVPGRNAHFKLSFSDLSEKDAARPVDEVFADLRRLYIRPRPDTPRSDLLKEQVLEDRGFTGREYHLTTGNALASRIKVFVSGRWVYRAIAVNPPGAEADRDAERFISSFRFEVSKP